MKKKIIIILITIGLFVSLLVFFLVQKSQTTIPDKELFGISGFAPVNYPDFTDKDATNYWKDINEYANLYGVHTSLNQSDIVSLYSKYLDMHMYLIIDASDVYDIDKLYTILDSNPKVIFLGIGHEVNVFKNDNPQEYETFFEEAKRVFPIIKSKYKDIKLFTTFQYESLLGKAYLLGKENTITIDILKDWEDIVDFYSFTVYPHLDYEDPNGLPLDYFNPITSITNKRFAIHETTWPSEITVLVGDNINLNTSQVEQKDYISWLKNINDKYNPEFINWLFLNDIEFGSPAFTGSALRDNLGNPKLAAEEWINILNKKTSYSNKY